MDLDILGNWPYIIPMSNYTAANFEGKEKGEELMLTAISSKGNAVERFGAIDKVHETGITIKLLDRDKEEFRRVNFKQITDLIFL